MCDAETLQGTVADFPALFEAQAILQATKMACAGRQEKPLSH